MNIHTQIKHALKDNSFKVLSKSSFKIFNFYRLNPNCFDFYLPWRVKNLSFGLSGTPPWVPVTLLRSYNLKTLF